MTTTSQNNWDTFDSPFLSSIVRQPLHLLLSFGPLKYTAEFRSYHFMSCAVNCARRACTFAFSSHRARMVLKCTQCLHTASDREKSRERAHKNKCKWTHVTRFRWNELRPNWRTHSAIIWQTSGKELQFRIHSCVDCFKYRSVYTMHLFYLWKVLCERTHHVRSYKSFGCLQSVQFTCRVWCLRS